MLELIRQPFRVLLMLLALFLLLPFAGLPVQMDVALAAATNMVVLIRRLADCQLGDDFRIVGHPRRGSHVGGADVAGSAATSRVGAVALVAVGAFADNTGIDVLGGVCADVALASAAVRDDWFVFAHGGMVVV